MEDDPLRAVAARTLVRQILHDGGKVHFTFHALEEMDNDDLQENDCLNLLRAAHVWEPEWENGQWRYRAETPRMAVVFIFPDRTCVTIITAWRKS